MKIRTTFTKRIFHFGFNARTSRGAMNQKTSWLVKVWDESNADCFGIGECGPLPGLSLDDIPDYENILTQTLRSVESDSHSKTFDEILGTIPLSLPSILFGLETAFKDLQHGGKRIIYDNPFIHGQPIPINGLIWMGDRDFMHEQIKEKIGQGFSCLKLKIGGLDFRTECDVIESIRKEFSEDLTIRLDANGSFKSEEALEKLRILSDYNIHSIEQPLPVDSPTLRNVCENSSIPIALDEELIAHVELNGKISLLERVRPHYIILKPTLHGGMKGCREWISGAEQLGIAWWITSALESNIGLNAICQFTAEYDVELPQGLGTGAIYTDNIGSPLTVRDGHIYIDDRKSWDAL